MFTRLTEVQGDDFMRDALNYSDRAFLDRQRQQQGNQNTYNFQDDSEIQVIDLEKELPIQRQPRVQQNTSIPDDSGVTEVKNLRFNIEINIKINVRS